MRVRGGWHGECLTRSSAGTGHACGLASRATACLRMPLLLGCHYRRCIAEEAPYARVSKRRAHTRTDTHASASRLYATDALQNQTKKGWGRAEHDQRMRRGSHEAPRRRTRTDKTVTRQRFIDHHLRARVSLNVVPSPNRSLWVASASAATGRHSIVAASIASSFSHITTAAVFNAPQTSRRVSAASSRPCTRAEDVGKRGDEAALPASFPCCRCCRDGARNG